MSEYRNKEYIESMGDVYYCILLFDTSMSADEMMDMAEEIINAR